jgi:uncharacterized protein (DUF2267 family)
MPITNSGIEPAMGWVRNGQKRLQNRRGLWFAQQISWLFVPGNLSTWGGKMGPRALTWLKNLGLRGRYGSSGFRPVEESVMSAVGLEALEHTVQITHVWINDLDRKLGWDNKSRAYRLLKAVLHALRDWLQVNDSAHLAAQLPELLRGAYYEQWRPAIVPVKKRGKAEFIARVQESFKADPIENPAQAVLAVFELLSKKITRGEIEKVRRALPQELRNLWPEHYVAPGAVG